MKPNVIYIYADDLGRGMLSCYGQKHFRTPNIDRLAREGMRFTRAYGTAFCAPARASLEYALDGAAPRPHRRPGARPARRARPARAHAGAVRLGQRPLPVLLAALPRRERARPSRQVYDQLTTRFTSEASNDVFDGNDGMAGLKTTNWEGGARIPFLARWPGTIAPDAVSSHLIANYDTLATFAELAGEPIDDAATDGISYLPVLRGEAGTREHEHVVYASHLGPSLVTRKGWKLRTFLRRDRIVDFSTFGAGLGHLDSAVTWQLYHLPSDPREERDLATEQPERVRELRGRLLRECDGNLVHGTPEAHFAFWNVG